MMKLSTRIRAALTIVAIFFLTSLDSVNAVAEDKPLELLRSSRRIVFLGDSITYAGQYVAYFDAWLLTQELENPPVVIDLGLPSETVSGLSEDGHAGGKFPRPDLAERLERVLAVSKPDLVFACYGINCGIYQPFDDERFRSYQQGIENLKKQVEAAGAKLVLITPPFFDDQRAKKSFSYNEVLDRYAAWLLAKRQKGWIVVDLHGPMTAAVAARREKDPEFTFQPDAVHPNDAGHWFIAQQLMSWFEDQQAAAAKSPEELLAARKITDDVLKAVRQRLDLRRDAYLSAAGHNRPGIKGGLPIEEAEQQAAQLTAKIQESVRAQPDSHPNRDIFLLPYFLGNGETGIYFAYSRNGLNFEWLNEGHVVVPAPAWGEESLTRDPSIVYHDGIFHMVWTTSWNSRSIGYAHSRDLREWSQPKKIDIWSDFKEVRNTWAPELHWDPEQEEFLILWSSTTTQELGDGDGSGDPHGYDHRTYASRTKDFQTFSKPEIFFSPQNPEYSVIDPCIARDDRGTEQPDDDRWVMVIKNELGADKGGKNLRLTFSDKMQGPYQTKLGPPIVGVGTSIVDQMAEGPSLFKRDGQWFLYWDAPESPFSYCLATSPDLMTWTNRSEEMSLPAKQMRHGTVLVVPAETVLQNTGHEYHVAPDGDNAHSGTPQQPFAAFARAQQAVRTKRARHPDQGVTVTFQSGRYELDATLQFDAADLS